MLTFLDLLNRFLGYFNIQDKAKGKAFTIVAFIANFYILYVAIENLRYAHYRVYGVLFMIGFLLIEYFILLNFIYYFTDKKFKFDISPKIEKLLGGNQAQLKAAEAQLTTDTQSSPANGFFADDKILPTAVSINKTQQANIEALVDQLVQQGALSLNYQGLDDHAVSRVAQKTHQPVAAMGANFELPYFDLQRDGKELVVLAGINALTPSPVATIKRVGLMPVHEALRDYELAAAHVFLSGGESKQMGRHALMTKQESFSVVVQVAYVPRSSVTGQPQESLTTTAKTRSQNSSPKPLPRREDVKRK